MDFSAYYGTFNLDMLPIEVIDVRAVIRERFLDENGIVIPAGINFNDFFTDPVYGKRKFLQIKVADRIYNIIEDDYDKELAINFRELEKNVKLVYYVYVNPNSNWRGIISGQLLQLKGLGILDEVDLYIHVTDTTGNLEKVVSFIGELYNGARISTSTENHFEYPGIRLIYDLAQKNPDCFFVYMHSKGMSANVHSRTIAEQMLLTGTFEDWRRKLSFFSDDRINKIGLFPAIGDDRDSEKPGTRGGWIWFNFWYARGRYLVKCDEPKITEDRYYFEHWLGLQNGKLVITNDCYNLYRRTKKAYFTPSKAVDALREFVISEGINF